MTSTLALHLLHPIGRDFAVTGAPLRAGSTHVVLDAEVRDGEPAGEPCAVASMTFTLIPRRANTTRFLEPEAEQFAFAESGSGLREPFLEQIGGRVVDAPLADAAAESVASARMVEGVATTDLQIHFLALGRVGPVRTRTRWLAGSPLEGRLRVELVDTGQRDRLMAVAVVRVARLG